VLVFATFPLNFEASIHFSGFLVQVHYWIGAGIEKSIWVQNRSGLVFQKPIKPVKN
jgi:hypothetical protein